MQPPNHMMRSRSAKVRILAGLVSLAMSAIYTFQLTATYDRDPYLAGMFILIACLQIVYGTVLLTQPWSIDSIGRIRPDAAARGRHWFQAGVAGNLALTVVLSASLAGVIPPMSTGAYGLLSVILGVLLIALLMTLVKFVG